MNRTLLATLCAFAAAFFALAIGIGHAALPQSLNYQGHLANAGGTPVTNPAVPMTFSIFTAASGGSPLWSESQSVAVNAGVFNVTLGAGSLLAGSPLGSLAFDVPYYLEVTAGGETLLPRTALASSPYAFRAASLDPAATVAGTVPPGFMIIGTSTTAPPGFSFAGYLGIGSFTLFVRDGTAGQAIQLSDTTLSVAEGASKQLMVTLATAPPSNVTVLVSSINTAFVTVSPATLTFTPGNYSTPQAVTVTALQDADAVDNGVQVALGAAGIATAYVDVTSVDDDVQAIVRSAATVGVTEGLSNTFTANLAFQPVASVTVNLASSNPAAATASPGTLTFTPANYATPQTVTVTGTQDANTANEVATVTLSSPGIASSTVTVNVTDDEVQALVLDVLNGSISESGNGTFTVMLQYAPVSGLTVTITSGNTLALTVAPSFLFFTAANYAVPQTVTMSGVHDANLTPEIVAITVSASGVTPNLLHVVVNDTGP